MGRGGKVGEYVLHISGYLGDFSIHTQGDKLESEASLCHPALIQTYRKYTEFWYITHTYLHTVEVYSVTQACMQHPALSTSYTLLEI